MVSVQVLPKDLISGSQTPVDIRLSIVYFLTGYFLKGLSEVLLFHSNL